MKLLIVRGDLQSQSGYSAAIRAYCTQLRGFFDQVAGVDIHFSPDRPFEPFPYPICSDEQARRLAARAAFTLALSITTPDCYRRFANASNVGMTFWETDRWPMLGNDRSPWVARANGMDALWAPSRHSETVFRDLGVSVPIRVIPWPIETPAPDAGLPDGTVYDLDRPAPTLPYLRNRLLKQLRVSAGAIPGSGTQSLLCVAQDVPRKGLLLLLSEWMEFKRRPEAAPWTLILKSKPHCPSSPHPEFVGRFWQHVQLLKRQLKVSTAGVYLWVEDMDERGFDRLLANTYGSIVPSLGEGFCGPAALALALKKPLVAPRHTSLADYLADDYPYCFATRPVRMRLVGDDQYGVHSTWHVAEPCSLANALSRLVTDSPIRREAACSEAQDNVARWCRPERVRRLLDRALLRFTHSQFKATNELPPQVARGTANCP